MRHAGRLAAAALSLLLGAGLLAGCEPGGGGSGGPDDPVTTGSGGGAGTPGSSGAPSPVPTALAECTDREKGLRDAPPDLSGWSVVRPDGFHPGSEGTHFAPIEGDCTQSYFNLDETGWPNQVGLNHWGQLEQGSVTNPCGQLLADRVLERLQEQAVAGGAVVVAEPTETEVAGFPAWTSDLDYPAYDVRTRNYWVYAERELVHVECQWSDTYDDVVLAACEEFLADLAFS